MSESADRRVLIADGVTVRRGRRDVIRDLDLVVGDGEVVALLGPNGAGKSTLVQTLGGLLSPSAGRISCEGRIGSVLQTPGLARRSVRANVELALAWWGVPRRQRRRRALDALALMRADHLATRSAASLSGGEQRRVHLARAVAVSPDLMLLDEPFDGLDPQTHEALRHDTMSAIGESGGAVIVVLHERADAWAIADRVIVLLDGRIRADGSPQTLLDAPPSAEVARFLGYDGELGTERGTLMTRAANVVLADDGDLVGTVTRRIGIEGGHRLQVQTARGTVWTLDYRAGNGPGAGAVGDEVRFTVRAGTEFAGTESREGSDEDAP